MLPKIPDFKYSITGKKLLVDEAGTWIRKTADWKPHQVPAAWWAQCPDFRDQWRKMYPDPRKNPASTAQVNPVADMNKDDSDYGQAATAPRRRSVA